MATYHVLTGLIDEMIDPALPKADVVGGPLEGLNGWLSAALAAEPDAVDPSERGPVTRWLGYVFGQPRISKADASALLPLQPGDPNPFFQVVDAASREGSMVQAGSSPTSLATIGPVTREMWMTPEYAIALVLTGGDVDDLPVWFELDDPTVVCPFGDGEETWETWGTFGESHVPVQIGDKWYRSNAVGVTGQLMKASEWAALMMLGSLKAISRAAFLEIQAAAAP